MRHAGRAGGSAGPSGDRDRPYAGSPGRMRNPGCRPDRAARTGDRGRKSRGAAGSLRRANLATRARPWTIPAGARRPDCRGHDPPGVRSLGCPASPSVARSARAARGSREQGAPGAVRCPCRPRTSRRCPHGSHNRRPPEPRPLSRPPGPAPMPVAFQPRTPPWVGGPASLCGTLAPESARICHKPCRVRDGAVTIRPPARPGGVHGGTPAGPAQPRSLKRFWAASRPSRATASTASAARVTSASTSTSGANGART